MRRAGLLAAAALAILVAGCEQGRPPEEVKQIAVENPYHDRLNTLSDQYRRLAIMDAIRRNGRRCQRVEVTRFQEDYRGMKMWVALCNDGRHWATFIAPNGDTQVRSCDDSARLRLPQCHPLTIPPPAADMGNQVGNSG